MFDVTTIEKEAREELQKGMPLRTPISGPRTARMVETEDAAWR